MRALSKTNYRLLKEGTDKIISFGEIEKYLRTDLSQAYGIVPINKDLFKLAYLKYYFCWLNQLRKDPQKYYSKRPQLEELLNKAFNLMQEIHENDTSKSKLLRLNIDEDLVNGLATMISQCRDGLAEYDKNKNRRKKKNTKGFSHQC